MEISQLTPVGGVVPTQGCFIPCANVFSVRTLTNSCTIPTNNYLWTKRFTEQERTSSEAVHKVHRPAGGLWSSLVAPPFKCYANFVRYPTAKHCPYHHFLLIGGTSLFCKRFESRLLFIQGGDLITRDPFYKRGVFIVEEASMSSKQNAYQLNTAPSTSSILEPPIPDTPSPTVDVLFSDVDGTLVHYPKQFSEYADIVSTDDVAQTAVIRYKGTDEERECLALTSKTGGSAYISRRTGDLIATLRRLGVVFVIITGARASTYQKRRPRLPEADFEFYENGGRKIHNGKLDPLWSDAFSELIGPIPDREAFVPFMPEPAKREGALWRLYSHLLSEKWVVDAHDYTTNIRVDVARSEGKTAECFKEILKTHVVPHGLASSFNLGKADIYPATSGKARAAQHVLDTIGADASNAVALFDDDNDIELGTLCGASFLPSVTHDSILEAIKLNRHWTLMERPGFLGTEDALERVIELRKKALALQGRQTSNDE